MLGVIAFGGYDFKAASGQEPSISVLTKCVPVFDELVTSAFDFLGLRQLLPTFLMPSRARALRFMGDLNVIARDVLAKGRASRDLGDLHPSSILATILTLQNPATGRPLPDSTLASEVIAFVEGGLGSTSRTLAWALYAIATNPAVEAKLQEELDEVLGCPRDEMASYPPLTNDGIGRMPYLAAVLKESMRLFPVFADGMMREADRDVVLPGGWLVKKGELVQIPLFSICSGSGFAGAFARPTEFWPERWLPPADGGPAPAVADGSALNFTPFSTGNRDCPGQSLALFETKAVLAILCHRFVFRRPSGSAELKGTIDALTMGPEGGLPMIISRRPGPARTAN